MANRELTFHTKPGSADVSVHEVFPINFEFVSFDDKGSAGFRVGYSVRF